MAVGKHVLPPLLPVDGIRIGVTSAGIKTPGRNDLVIFEILSGANTAAVFTQNRFCAAPVHVAKRHLQQTAPAYFIINTGNANAGTGSAGLKDALMCCQQVATLAGCAVSEVLPFSTGVIGEPLPVTTIVDATGSAFSDLANDQWAEAASGIMTTDTRPKGVSARIDVQGVAVTVTGISKGAGMIKPNMATMLAFIATDAPICQPVLQQLIQETTEKSFNRITVDSDTSTNDACLFVATGKADLTSYKQVDDPVWQPFRKALDKIFLALAHEIVKDAEGATKFVEVRVEQAESESDALQVAYTIAHSPLVKTALFACDPNWGRILAAVGRAPVSHLEVNKISIWLDSLCIVRDGCRAADYEEQAGQRVMDQEELVIRVSLGAGEESVSVWTSDLSHDYVRINAEYRT